MLSDFYNHLKAGSHYSKHTVSAYYSDCLAFMEFFNIVSIEDLREISHKVLRGWFAGLMQQGMSARSIRRKMAACKLFFEYYCQVGVLKNNPMDKVTAPKIKSRLPVFFNETSLQQALTESEIINNQDYSQLRNRTIIELLYATGIRRGELVGLTLSDVDIQQQQIKVLGKGNKERLIPLLPTITEILQQYIELRKEQVTEHNTLFLTDKLQPIYPKMVHNIVTRFFLTTNNNINVRKSPHTFRHTFATHLLNRGAQLNDIKTLLGHSNLSATQIYTHTTFEKLKTIHKKLHPRS